MSPCANLTGNKNDKVKRKEIVEVVTYWWTWVYLEILYEKESLDGIVQSSSRECQLEITWGTGLQSGLSIVRMQPVPPAGTESTWL